MEINKDNYVRFETKDYKGFILLDYYNNLEFINILNEPLSLLKKGEMISALSKYGLTYRIKTQINGLEEEFIVKRFILERLKWWVKERICKTKAFRNFENCCSILKEGVKTPISVVVLVEKRRVLGANSFLVLKSIPCSYPLNEFFEEVSEKEGFISKLAEFIHGFHKKGIFHQDLIPENILVRKDTGEFYLIDLDRSVICKRLPSILRDSLKIGDLRRFLKYSGFQSKEKELFLERYCALDKKRGIKKRVFLYFINRYLEKEGSFLESKERFDASIVIPTFNRRVLLDRCLTHLFSQNYPKDKYEIIIIDDGSKDGTKEMVYSKHPPCRLRYFYQKRVGPAKARNLGINVAEGRVIVFIDSDIFAPPNLLSNHLMIHKGHKDIIVSGPVTRTSDLNEDFRDIRWRKFRKLFDLSGVSLITSNLSIRREHLLKVGGFDEEFKGYGWHDWDLGLRLKRQGLIPRRIINAIAYHYTENRMDLQEICKKRRERGENAILYLKKHPSLRVLLSIHLHFLLYDKLITPFIKDERFKKRFPGLTKRWSLIHYYSDGLKEGLKRHNIKLIDVLGWRRKGGC